jgi:biotin synthase
MTLSEVSNLYNLPLFQLVSKANAVHEKHFKPGEIQGSSLLSIKTGGCPENCSYCPQSAHYKTGVEKVPMMETESILESARKAKAAGATRFCMGAAWREVKDGPQFDSVLDAVRAVRETGLEVCCTLGMVTKEQAVRLKDAGLYAYNHNLDTSRNFYGSIVQTRTYDDRLETIENVRGAGLTVCTGGILGLGESEQDRIEFIHQLVSIEPVPESLTINTLVPLQGTPLEKQSSVSALDVARVVATLRILAPTSKIRLSAGRLSMSDEGQFLCYLAGANSIFLGDKLLTSPNPSSEVDAGLLGRLGYQLSKQSDDYV